MYNNLPVDLRLESFSNFKKLLKKYSFTLDSICIWFCTNVMWVWFYWNTYMRLRLWLWLRLWLSVIWWFKNLFFLLYMSYEFCSIFFFSFLDALFWRAFVFDPPGAHACLGLSKFYFNTQCVLLMLWYLCLVVIWNLTLDHSV